MTGKASFSSLFADSPLLLLLLPLVAGIFLADCLFEQLRGDTLLLIASGMMLLAATLLVAARSKRWSNLLKGLGIVGSMGLLGAALLVADRDGEDIIWPESARIHRLLITDTPRTAPRSTAFTGRILGGTHDGKDVSWRIVTSESDSLYNLAQTLHPGDVLLCHGRVTPLRDDGNPSTFSYAEWQRRQGIVGSGFSYAGAWRLSQIPAKELPLAVRALRLRSEMTQHYAAHFEGRSLAIMSSMTLGDTSHLDPDTRQLYSQTGTSHILALSGVNLTILFSIYQFLILKALRRYRLFYIVASLVGIVGLWAFTLLAGCPLSLVRAAIMFSLMQAASLLRRDGFSLQNLALSAFLILLFSPQSLFDIGFQLSVFSVLGILLLANRIPKPRFVANLKPLRGIWDIVSISLCCQLVTAPLVAYHFHSFPVYGLLANLIAVPAAYILLILAVVFFLLPFLQDCVALIADWLLCTLDNVLSCINALPYSNIEVYPTSGTTILLYVLIVSALLFLYTLKRRYLLAALTALTVGVGLEKYADRPSRIPPQIIFYNLYGAAAVHFISSAAVSYVWQPRPVRLDFVRRTFWQPQGMVPQIYTDTLSTAELHAVGGITAFRGQRVALLNAALPQQHPPQPLAVDYLLIDRGFKSSLRKALLFFRPKKIVLSAALTAYYSKKYNEEAARLKLDVYDVERSGALIVAL